MPDGFTLLRDSVTWKNSKTTDKTRGKKIQSASICMGSTSADSTNCGLKIFREKKILESSKKAKLEFATHWQHFYTLVVYTLDLQLCT